MSKKRLLLASLVVFAACTKDVPKFSTPGPTPPANATKPPAEAPAKKPAPLPDKELAPVKGQKPVVPVIVDMDAAIKTLMAKAEQPDESIEVQHILIAFQGVPRVTGVTRSKDEAKALAQKVYAEAAGGADFLALVKKYTNDSAPGIYPLTKAGRAGMAKSFGDVGFRLKVGDIGVAPWEATASPFGWHIIKRLK